MPWGAAAAATATIAGSYLSGQAAKSAANTSADAQRYAADQSARAAAFKPVGVKTNLGTSNFTVDEYGNISQAGYTLDPRLQNIQNNIYGQAGAYNPEAVGQAAQPLMGGAASAFNLGQQYLATSPQQASADWMAQQRELLAPGYEQQLAGIRNSQFQTGRTGLATGGTSAGNLMQTNPELAAFYNAKAQQERTLASQADAYGQERAKFGLGLFGTGGSLLGQVPSLTSQGYGPLQTQLGLVGSIEGMGQQPFDLSTALGAKSATAGANVGKSLLEGGTNAARTQQAGNSYSLGGSLLQGVGSNNALNSWFQNQINQPNYNNWQTSGDNTFFGSNSNGQGAGEAYSGFNASIGL